MSNIFIFNSLIYNIYNIAIAIAIDIYITISYKLYSYNKEENL